MTNTISERLALNLCQFSGDLACTTPCLGCKRLSANHLSELSAILRERHGGSSQVADWLDGIHTP